MRSSLLKLFNIHINPTTQTNPLLVAIIEGINQLQTYFDMLICIL